MGAREQSEGGSTRRLPDRFHYEVRVAEDLRELSAKVCFEGAVPDELRAGKDEAAVRLRYARWLSPGPVRRLPVENGRIQLDSSLRDACVEYGIALDDGGGMSAAVRHVASDVVASPNVWLWRPERRSPALRASLRLELPRGMSACLPWKVAADGTRELDASAFRFDSHAAFGHATPLAFTHRGVPVEAMVLDGALALDRAEIERWLRQAIDTVAMVGGRFPSERMQVLIVPSGPTREPVPFGTIARGGSSSVMLFTSSTASEAELTRDWVLPHELSHLWLPFVDRDDAWISEGLATYLQEVLRARSGVLDDREAIDNVVQALRSAVHEGTGRTLAEESREMYHTHAFRSVYWGGAAFFLMADVELRRRTHGKRSLDDILLALTGAQGETWSAERLLARMDELSGQALFVPLAEQELARPFPAFEATLEALGVRNEGTRLALDDAAPLAELRRAIFGARR